jgi:D-alanyl-D-alanine carboxypeptidase/D-alanyl-D-alanine-endopeptidase (penicillin-binding protein 4)
MQFLFCLICLFLYPVFSVGQDIGKKLQAAALAFEKDSQMRYAIYSLHVVDGKTGKLIFDKNGNTGLPPASTQKLFTSVAAFEVLGRTYKYKTDLLYQGNIANGTLQGNLLIRGSGDPSFGSWRFENTKQDAVLREFRNAIAGLKVRQVTGGVGLIENGWLQEDVPGGWIWEDIGNYYGAFASSFNWRENQFDLFLRPGKREGDPAEIVGTEPELNKIQLTSEVTTGKVGSGDNAYIYLPPYASRGRVRGTIPPDEPRFTISGSYPDAANQFVFQLAQSLKNNSIQIGLPDSIVPVGDTTSMKLLSSIYSPSLDSLNYYFLRRSINLYGEALIKTIAFEKSGIASTEKGVELVRNFWGDHGVEKAAINIIDGSGLSPQNRVTTKALVQVLQFAKTRPWYNSFYLSLPTYNGMKMKSGSIGGARSFAGYHTSRSGHEYIFAIIVNNYDGSPDAVIQKMYKLLDTLK